MSSVTVSYSSGSEEVELLGDTLAHLESASLIVDRLSARAAADGRPSAANRLVEVRGAILAALTAVAEFRNSSDLSEDDLS